MDGRGVGWRGGREREREGRRERERKKKGTLGKAQLIPPPPAHTHRELIQQTAAAGRANVRTATQTGAGANGARGVSRNASSAAVAALVQRAEATGKLCTVIIGNGESDQDAAAFAARLVDANVPFVAVLHGGIGSVLQEEKSHLYLMVMQSNESYF